MSRSLRIRYKGLPASTAVDSFIESQFQHLEQAFKRQTFLDAQLTLELLNQRAGKAGCYHVAFELAVPGHRFMVGKDPGRQMQQGDVYTALQAAFQAMNRQLRSYTERLRGDVKHHEAPAPTASVEDVYAQV